MSDSMRPPMGNSLSPEPCALIPVLGFPSIDLTVGAEAATSDQATSPDVPTMDGHIHAFAPFPVGTDGREAHEPPHPQRFRNRCSCGTWQTPCRLGRGPNCRRCGLPTVLGLADPDNPLHPCCAEPELMALGAAARRRNR